MNLTKSRVQFLAVATTFVVVSGIILLWGMGPRATATAVAAPARVSAMPTVAPVSGGAGVAVPLGASRADYATALSIWDGAMMAGDASDAAHWLAAGMLMSRGDYSAARAQLKAVLAIVPPNSPVGLKARMMLAGTAGGHKLIALAFDDFPFPNGSPPMLEMMSRDHVPVTYFAIGHKVRDYPDLVAEAAAQGDSIQNHTFDHIKLSQLPPDKIRYEIEECSKYIRQYTGVTPRYLRGPHAATNATVDRIVRECGLICVDPIVTNIFDWHSTASITYRRCLARAKPGAILDLHDGIPATEKVMPAVIAALRARGYEFVTVDQLLGGGSLPIATEASTAAGAPSPAAALAPWGQMTPAPSLADPDAAR